MKNAGKALTTGLKQEWQDYGVVGRRVVVGGSLAIAVGMGAAFAFTKPVCPAHPLIGVGNVEFRCPAPK
jgi:hypothetical protein